MAGWMNYVVIIGNLKRRVYFRNGNMPYIRIAGRCVDVFFNPCAASDGKVECEVDLPEEPLSAFG